VIVTGQVILIGWKAIAAAFGFSSVATIRKTARSYRMPIKYINHRPTITIRGLENWWENCLKMIPLVKPLTRRENPLKKTCTFCLGHSFAYSHPAEGRFLLSGEGSDNSVSVVLPIEGNFSVLPGRLGKRFCRMRN